MAGEVEETKAALVALLRHLADGIEGGSIEPKAFNSLGGVVGKNHGKLKVNIESGSHQLMLLYDKP